MHAFLKREWDWTVKFVPTFVWVKISWIQFVAYNIKVLQKVQNFGLHQLKVFYPFKVGIYYYVCRCTSTLYVKQCTDTKNQLYFWKVSGTGTWNNKLHSAKENILTPNESDLGE